MVQFEILVCECSPVYWFATCAIKVCEVSALSHEPWYDTMENWVLEPEASIVSAESSEILCCFGYHFVEKLENYTTVLESVFDVEEYFRFWHAWYGL